MDEALAARLMEGWSSGGGDRPEQLRFWTHPTRGTFVAGLFDMYQTHGFPLSDSMLQAKKVGAKLCPMQERASALANGWTPEKFDRWWAEGLADSGRGGTSEAKKES